MPDNEFLNANEYLTANTSETLQSLKEDENFLYVQGIALTATQVERFYGTLNISPEELQKATPTLIGKPFLKDHEQSVDSIIGKIEQAQYEDGKAIITAKILKKGNEALIEKIKAGLATKLSAGFKRKLQLDEKNGWYDAKDIEFFEVSLVWQGADKNATLLEKNFKKEELQMSEKLTIEQLSKEKAQLEEKLGKLKAENENLKQENEILKTEIDKLKQLSKLGQEYIENLRADVKKWITLVEGEKAEGLLKIVETAELDQLKAFKEVYEPKAKELLQNKAQQTEKDQFSDIETQGEKLNKPINEMTLEELKALEEKFMKEVN